MPHTILIVDDSAITRQVLRNILAEEYDVAEAADGKSALAYLRLHGAKTALVVTDVLMPVMTGYELMEAVRAESSLSHIPIIVSTGSEGQEAELEALRLGAVDFILKPFSPEIIKQRIRNIIRLASLSRDMDELRVSEERYRIAASAGGRVTARYDIQAGIYYKSEGSLTFHQFGPAIENVPQAFIDAGIIHTESVETCLSYFKKMTSGDKTVSAILLVRVNDTEFRWFRCEATVIFDAHQQPAQAIIVYTDITDERKKEAVYLKWQQSLMQKDPETFTLFHCNLSRDNAFETMDGNLLRERVQEKELSFEQQTNQYAGSFVYPEDREMYTATVDADLLLANFYRNQRQKTIEFRELQPDNNYRWLRLTIELVEYPSSADIGAYLMFENIDEEKRNALRVQALAERDPLTGVFNRNTFAEKVTRILQEARFSEHAFLMVDIDRFKQLNDTFGHAAGDQALIEIAQGLNAGLRHGDLLGRLGGDEFVLFMREVPYDAVIEKKAQQICSLVRKSYSVEVQLSASIGIAVYPRDGDCFETLYQNADAALYGAKDSGKDAFCFYDGKQQQYKHRENDATGVSTPKITGGYFKRRMLIVDDSEIDRTMLASIFSGEYIIVTARDGREAMVMLKHYGSSLSVVLLDIMMPGMDGIAVLEQMRERTETQSVPVIVVSGQEDRDINLRAIRAGASDFITKPVSPDIIRIRVESAVSKAESERLRAQNSYLLLQNSEEAKYRTVLDSTGTVVVEYDWLNGVFTYDLGISKHIAGTFDNRRLWQILMSDMVADAMDVKAMQELVHALSIDRQRTESELTVRLRTPEGKRNWFRMRVFRCADQYRLTNKMIITFNDINADVLAMERLHYQAERDELTGLFNRKTFFEKCADRIAKKPAGYYVMACFDVDNFKIINDQYGAKKGDEVLRQLADVFRDGFTAADGIVGRITADNYAVLYPATFMYTKEIERLRGAASVLDGSMPPISFSIGRYVVDDLSITVSGMYDRATLAQNKIKGRYDEHVAQYNETMRDELILQQQVISEMKHALETRQFEIWFQPQYNHATGARIGAEALVRWRHPRRGFVPPGEFIPAFERSGFVYELDKFVWEETCRYLRKWLDEGRNPLAVSVNISRYDILRRELCEVITGLVHKYDLSPTLLRLEITESAFAKDTDRIVAVVKQLISRGFTIEIDDFGSGYSSLNTLKDVPAQVLKMDMRFLETKTCSIDSSCEDSSSRGGNILESVVRMAKWLGMSVIAEGVETKAQADYLTSIGCNYIQGYLYARPMCAADYEERARQEEKEEKLLALEAVENHDNNRFWDPASMDTLIFNTYVGGACIFEWTGGRIEILRVNDKFARTLGGTGCLAEDILKLDLFAHMDGESTAAAIDAIERAIASGDDAVCEARCHDLFGDGKDVYVRTTFRVIARTANRYLVYATVDNLTVERELERQRLAAQQQLEGIMANVDGGISAVTMDEHGAYSFIFANDTYYSMLGYTREQFTAEVCNALAPVVPEDRGVLSAAVEEAFAKAGSAAYEFRCTKRNGDVIYLRTNASVTSLVGVRTPVLLSVSTDITAWKTAERQIRDLNENLQNMMDDMPGGFARLRLRDNNVLVTEYVNDNFCRLRGMTREEILSSDHENAMGTIHPDDLEQVKLAISEMLSSGITSRLQYRLLHKSGAYIPLTVFGRVSRTETGEQVINAYYADMSEEEKRALAISAVLPIVLSTIMSSTTDLSFVKNMEFRYLSCSKPFAQLVGVDSEADIVGKTDYDIFEKSIADAYRADDLRLLSEGEPLIDYLEPIPSIDGLQHYSSTSKYVLRNGFGEAIGLYGVGRDVTEVRTAFDRLKLLADSIPGGLVTYALYPEGLRVVYFNDGMCRLFGCTREEYAAATKESVITTVFEEDIPRLQAQIQRMTLDGTPVDCTYRIRSMKGDGIKWINLRATQAERRGGILQANAVLYDVTEQKLAAEAAHIHEEEMRFAVSQLGKMLCEYDPNTRLLTVPEEYAAKYNLPAVIADVPASIAAAGVIREDTLPAYLAFYEAVLRGDKTGSAEYCEKRADGQWYWERIEFFSVFDANGKPIKTIIAAEDTTQQHLRYELEQARPTLGEDNLLVHALFNLNTGETLEYAYSDGREVPVEERTAFLFGGDDLDRIIADDEERRRYRELNDSKKLLELYEKGETGFTIDYRRRLPGGEILWVRNLLRMVRKPNGSDILLFEYCYNIEKEKIWELLYATLLRENYDYVARVNGITGQFELLASREEALGILPGQGGDLSQVAELWAQESIHPDDRATILACTTLEGVRRKLADTDYSQITFRLVLPSGELRYKKLSVYMLDRARGIIIAAREDVSAIVCEEMQKSEQLMSALDAANQASRARSQFLTRMSHALRTPLNAIIGLAALSAAEVNDPPAMEDAIGKIDTSARYLLSLLNDILEMSRIESGKMSLNEAPFDFEHLIGTVNTAISAKAEEKGVDYGVAVNGCIEPSYVGDERKLTQILVNILGNAVKFTPRGGKVTLGIEQLRRTEEDASLRFTVTDTGVGIDEAFLPHLFDLFAQESVSHAPTVTGTGLGLAIAQNLVNLMNGRITVKSTKGAGSEFTVVVRVGVTRDGERCLDAASSMRLDRLRALVAVDDGTARRHIEDILNKLGMQAEWADSGASAVDSVQRRHDGGNDFDTVLIDRHMPDMDGAETARRIRQIVGPCATVILLTDRDRRSIEAEARAAGVDLFLEKPVLQSAIVQAFEQALMKHACASAPKPAARPDFTGRRVLLVEDNPLNTEVAKRMLETVGAEVTTAGNGLEAIETFMLEPAGHFDAILMDIRMPVMDGLTAAKNIRNLRKAGSKTVPIVAMTANAFDEDVELSLSSGMDAHLIKPVEPDLLFATLKQLFLKQ